MLTKQEFLSKPKYSKLSRAQKEQRWKSYLATSNTVATARPIGYPRRSPPRSQYGYIDPALHALSEMPTCATHYLQALEDPFGLFVGGKDACIPDLHAVPSKKVHARTRGTMHTGLNGYGYIIAQSQRRDNDAAVESAGPIVYSLQNWGGAAGSAIPTPTITPTVGLTSSALTKLPYASTVFAAVAGTGGVQARVVGVGLRIRFIGPELARGGQLMAIRHPNSNTLHGLTQAELLSFENTKVYPVSREWTYVNYNPVRPNQYRYAGTSVVDNPGDPQEWDLGFLITGTTTSTGTPGPAPFEWEHVTFLEFVGRIDNITKTHVDVQAMSMIRNSTETHPSTRDPKRRLLKSLTMIGADHLNNASANNVKKPALALAYRGNDAPPSIVSSSGGTIADIVGKKAEALMESGINQLFKYGSKAVSYANKYLPSWMVKGGELLGEATLAAL